MLESKVFIRLCLILLFIICSCNSTNSDIENVSARLALTLISDKGEDRQIYLLNMPSMKLKRITSLDQGVSSGLDWNSNGSRLAFTIPSNLEGFRSINTINVDGSNLTTLLDEDGFEILGDEPSWNNTSTQIAYTLCISCESGSLNYDIYLVNLQNGSISMLTQHSFMDVNPFWSNDDSTVYFESGRDGNEILERRNLYAINLLESGIYKITDEDFIGNFKRLQGTNQLFFVSRIERENELETEYGILDLSTNRFVNQNFVLYESEENHSYSILDVNHDATKVYLNKRHSFNRDNGHILYEWDTTTGDLIEILSAYNIGTAKLFEYDK